MTHDLIVAAQAPCPAGEPRGNAAITVAVVADSRRLGILSPHCGAATLRPELSAYGSMARLCQRHDGGFWDHVELSNGSACMAPTGRERDEMRVDGNGVEDVVDAGAAGVVATLFGLNALRWQGFDDLAQNFDRLRELARQHPSSVVILCGID